MHLLTDAESEALRACFEIRNFARAAEEVAMTRRDLQVRMRRAAEKFHGQKR